MTTPTPVIPAANSISWVGWIVATIATVIFAVTLKDQIARAAVAEAQERASKHSLDSLAKIGPAIERVYVHDTVVLTRTLTRYTVAHDTVLAHLTDTMIVKQYVLVADSTIRACTAVVIDCRKRHTVDSAQAALWRAMYTAERAKQPGVIATWGTRLLFGLGGYGLARLTHP